MDLHDLIASEPANAARTDAEVLAWLHETVTVPDPTRVTTTTVMARLSTADSAVVFATLATAAGSNPLVVEALIQLRGDGIDLSHENARAMIDQLFDGNPTLRDKVKALGERQVPRCMDAGYPSVTEHDLAGLGDWRA